MKKNKGFTLIELIATIVILGLVATIGSYAISTTIKNSKEKNCELLIANIKTAAEMYYQDCKYITGPTGACTFNNNELSVTLETLIANGFLTSNKTKSQSGKLYNPKNDDEISACEIKIVKEQENINVKEKNSNDTKCPDFSDSNYCKIR